MTTPSDRPAEAARPETAWSVVTVRRTARRPLGRLFWVAVLTLPLAMTGFVGWSHAAGLEDALAADVHRTLRAEGIKGIRLRVDGRTVTAKVPTGRDPETVAAVAGAVPGVLAVRTRSVYASRREARACHGVGRKVDRATHGQRIPFSASGRLTGAGQAMVRDAGRLLTACRAVDAVVGGHVDSSVPNPGTVSLDRARVIVRALVAAGVHADRLEPRGYGDQFELVDDVTPAARARNQRGSIIVAGR